jgi:tetratricopeptide (TPR) repeat protein
MKQTGNQIIQQAVTSYKEGRHEDAVKLYRSALKIQPDNVIIYYNLGVTLREFGKIDEAEASYKRAIELKPDFLLAHYNLGNTLKVQGKFEEAQESFKKAIELKPDYIEAYNNLGTTFERLNKLNEAEASYKKVIELRPDFAEAHNNLAVIINKLGRLDEAVRYYKKAIELKPSFNEAHFNLANTSYELNDLNKAEASYKKVIELKPDLAEAHNNLGMTVNKMGRLDEAEACYKKAIELKPDYIEAHNNLDILLIENKLINILAKKKPKKNNKVNLLNPFIDKRSVEKELIDNLYKIDSSKLDEVDRSHLRYGNGRSSDYKLFENNSIIIKNVAEDLINIMKKVVKSDIFIRESFFNIFQTGSGITPHEHLSDFDKNNGLIDQKYSLVYYLSVGDQNCCEPGILKLYDPDQEILPSDGMVMIFPASRRHSAVYGGKIDRVMIGINFYSIS